MSDDAKFSFGFASVGVGVIIFFVILNYFLQAQRCDARWEAKFKPEYEFFAGCMINVNGQRIPAQNYRVL